MPVVSQMQARSAATLIFCIAPPLAEVSCNTAGIAYLKMALFATIALFLIINCPIGFCRAFLRVVITKCYVLVTVSIAVFSMNNKEIDCHSQFLMKLAISAPYQTILSSDEIWRQASFAIIYILPSFMGSEIEVLGLVYSGKQHLWRRVWTRSLEFMGMILSTKAGLVRHS